MAVFVALGVLANWVIPDARIPMPWTVFLLIMTGALCSSFYAFMGAARYSSPTLAAENMRFSRYPEPMRFASDGQTLWSAVPVNGWTFKKAFVNSGGNPAVSIQPAAMLEQDSEMYTVARCKLYHLSDRAVSILMRKRVFSRLLTDLGYSDQKRMDIYFGFQSGTLHPDVTHIRSSMDLAAYARTLATDERVYTKNSIELKNFMDSQLEFYERINREASPARMILRAANEEEDEQ